MDRVTGMEVCGMEKYQVGVIGGTGMVGQRIITHLEQHPRIE